MTRHFLPTFGNNQSNDKTLLSNLHPLFIFLIQSIQIHNNIETKKKMNIFSKKPNPKGSFRTRPLSSKILIFRTIFFMLLINSVSYGLWFH